MHPMLPDFRTTTAESVREAAATALAAADRLVATASASVEEPSFAATMVPIEHAIATVGEGYGRSAFMAYVHPDAAVRDAGQAAEERITKWRVSLPFRRELFLAVSAFAGLPEASALEGERRRLLDHWLRDFRRAGQELADDQREELERLRERLVEAEVAFQRNINESRDWIETDREGLAGMPDAFIERLAAGEGEGTFRVSLDYPEITPFLSQAHDRSLREALFRKNWNQAVTVNRPLLEQAMELRQQIAALLGYPTWAHYVLEVTMAGGPERVEEFYAELVPDVERAAEAEIAVLRRELEGDGQRGRVQPWDWLYYDTQLTRRDHGVDQDEISEYLPLDPILDGMFRLTGDVFGLEFRRLPEARAWHPSVQLFAVHDRDDGRLIAHFYADLFPREGKFNHAAAFPLVIGHRGADGNYVAPVNAIVANFTPPSGDRPSLLRHGPHGEIETLFHEFGHILHMSLTRAEFARFSAAETERDFVEAPSQITEHWVWEPEVLAGLSQHYRTGEPLPLDLVARMVGARYVNVGLRATRQVFFGRMDLRMHTTAGTPDLDRITREEYAVTRMPYPEGTFMMASFGHLMGGYDAGYYGYLWAEVIGDDMWSRFHEEGITSTDVGGAYRRAILEPNGSRDGDDLVNDFLGRPAGVDAYLRLRGLAGG
jgi:thimet oligopeptidase